MEIRIVVREVIGLTPYWAWDETLHLARTRFKRLTGKYPTEKAVVHVCRGDINDLDNITINDLGDLSVPKTVEVIKIQ